jgi:hypothetical protein
MGLDRILRHQAVVPAATVVETIAQLQTDFPISLIVMGDQTSASEWKERLAQLATPPGFCWWMNATPAWKPAIATGRCIRLGAGNDFYPRAYVPHRAPLMTSWPF